MSTTQNHNKLHHNKLQTPTSLCDDNSRAPLHKNELGVVTPKQDQLQTPASSICNDDSRAPSHKNEVGATVEPTNNKSKASKDINRAAALEQERLQKFENEYDRFIRFPLPQIRVLSDTETEFYRRRMLKEVFDEDWRCTGCK